MTICYFGYYDANYSRNKILIKGLRQNGVQVVECHSEKSGAAKFFELISKHKAFKNNYDVMVIGYPGFAAVPLAKILARQPVIFDAFVSLYDSNVFDRKDVKPGSVGSYVNRFWDWSSSKLSNTVLLDTTEHIDYMVAEYGISKTKYGRIFIGADDDIFYPREFIKSSDKFIIHFHGSFLPLQGTKYIIEAANIIRNENVIFNMLGGGKEIAARKKMVDELGLQNTVKFPGYIVNDEVPEYIAGSDICLGIFGDTNKTQRVIPNKVYECLAMAKPVLTADTPAAREALSEEYVMFCKVANSEDLAEKIMQLKNNPELRKSLAQKGHQLYKEKFSPKALGRDLLNIIEEKYGKK